MADQNLEIAIKVAADVAQADQIVKKFEEIKNASEALTNTGAGLASNPAKFFAEMEAATARALQLTAEQIKMAEQLEERLKRQITQKRLVGVEYEKEAEALKKVSAALAPARAEQERQSTVLEELKKNQQEETEETAKAVTAKQRLQEAARGVSTEFPIIGQVLRTLSSPLGAAIALFAIITKAIKDYSDEVRASGQSAQVFESMSHGVRGLASIQAELAGQAKAFAAAYGEIETAVNNATAKLNEWNNALLLKQRLEQKLDDETLKLDLARIATDKKLSPTEKITQSAFAQGQARKRQQDREFETLKRQADKEEDVAYNSGLRGSAAKAAAEAMKPQIAQAVQVAEAAAKEAADIPKFNEGAVAKNSERLETVRGMQEALKGGSIGSGAYQALHPVAMKDLVTQFGSTPYDKIEEQLLEEKRILAAQGSSAKDNAANKAAAAKALQDEQKRLEGIATEEETRRAKNAASSREKRETLSTMEAYRKPTDTAINEAEKIRTDAAVELEKKKAEDERKREAEKFNRENERRIEHGYPPLAPGIRAEGAGVMSEAAAMTGGFASSVENMGESVIALYGETQNRLNAVDEKLRRLIGQNNNTLIG